MGAGIEHRDARDEGGEPVADLVVRHSALKGVEELVIDDHASHCIEDALASGDRKNQRAKFTELLELLDKARG